jgi:hypothetical protein
MCTSTSAHLPNLRTSSILYSVQRPPMSVQRPSREAPYPQEAGFSGRGSSRGMLTPTQHLFHRLLPHHVRTGGPPLLPTTTINYFCASVRDMVAQRENVPSEKFPSEPRGLFHEQGRRALLRAWPHAKANGAPLSRQVLGPSCTEGSSPLAAVPIPTKVISQGASVYNIDGSEKRVLRQISLSTYALLICVIIIRFIRYIARPACIHTSCLCGHWVKYRINQRAPFG